MIRRQIDPVVQKMGCLSGSGNLDLPGSGNWYVPDLAVVPEGLADADALVPHQTLLVVEVTSESNGDTDRIVKRRRYAEYGAPLYLLVDRQERSCTLYAEPGSSATGRWTARTPSALRCGCPSRSDWSWTPRSSEVPPLALPAAHSPSASSSARCRARTPASWASWVRQEKPSARTAAPGRAVRTAGRRRSSAQATETS